ncbi:hypothetical protein TraAM80_10329 [Trypanosoma rangeli]|uniref:Uncharacterized protein n=1 Tax=Trypanosoma rangeli TaxID=5698 RepID=A0A3R7N2U4_TRYRA|nr:uncharacterized protein TraAM80_10329 [Trypanosoma rangeli]RNE95479.1 hypothetical protein TraAM80_10329 [Trypanosoma rangeli]|eukprot:RNE95479.1 hypothetical protein TraAM80_10329 [Trypanosoma rangeli]
MRRIPSMQYAETHSELTTVQLVGIIVGGVAAAVLLPRLAWQRECAEGGNGPLDVRVHRHRNQPVVRRHGVGHRLGTRGPRRRAALEVRQLRVEDDWRLVHDSV